MDIQILLGHIVKSNIFRLLFFGHGKMVRLVLRVRLKCQCQIVFYILVPRTRSLRDPQKDLFCPRKKKYCNTHIAETKVHPVFRIWTRLDLGSVFLNRSNTKKRGSGYWDTKWSKHYIFQITSIILQKKICIFPP